TFLSKSLHHRFTGEGKVGTYTPDPKVVAAVTMGRSRGTGQMGTFKLPSLASEVEVLSVELRGPATGVKADRLLSLLKTAPKDEVYRIKAVLDVAGTVRDSDQDDANP
ncbi:hypothetical protein BN1708_018349, partial [Verticillium longisporum]